MWWVSGGLQWGCLEAHEPRDNSTSLCEMLCCIILGQHRACAKEPRRAGGVVALGALRRAGGFPGGSGVQRVGVPVGYLEGSIGVCLKGSSAVFGSVSVI